MTAILDKSLIYHEKMMLTDLRYPEKVKTMSLEECINNTIYSLKISLTFCKEEQEIIDGQSKILNWAYNHLLEKALFLRKEYIENQSKESGKTLYTKRGLRNLLPDLKKQFPFLKSVHSSPLKNAALRLSESIQARQKSKIGTRKGKVTGFPKFRSYHQKWFSILYDEPKKGFKIEGRNLTLSLGTTEDGKRLKIKGVLEVPLSKLAECEVKNLRITKENNCYYAVFAVQRLLKKPLTGIKTVIALDPNHKNLAHGVSNSGASIVIENPIFIRHLDKRINQLKSKRDQCKRNSIKVVPEKGKPYYRPSRRWNMFHNKVQQLYKIRRDQTKVFLYTVANKLYKTYDLVSIGDYTPSGQGLNRNMRRVMNNESLIGRLKLTLEWVAKKSGKHYFEWDERGSTKTCNVCDFSHQTSLNPSIRSWTCPECETFHIRDENAAINGLAVTNKDYLRGSRHLEGLTVSSRCAWEFKGLGLVSIPGAFDGLSN